MYPDTGETPGTGAKGEKKKYGQVCRGALFTVENFEEFLLVNSYPTMQNEPNLFSALVRESGNYSN